MINLRTPEELKRAFEHLSETLVDEQILLETYQEGDDCRALIVGNKVVAACSRIPANVIGNGADPITELIRTKNKERRKNPFLSTGLIKIDYEVHECLSEQNLSETSIPPLGKHVYLRKVSNGSAGGDTVDITDKISDEIKDAAVRAVAAIPNIVIAGVDLLYKPRTKSSPETFTILEMNSRPHIAVNMYPAIGTGRDVPKALIDHFFPSTPRKGTSRDESLRFSFDAIREPLLRGAASGVTVANLPHHHLPYRRVYRLNNALFTRAQAQALMRVAKDYQISGEIRSHKQEGTELALACADEQTAQKLLQKITQYLHIDNPSSTAWIGVVTQGFVVPERFIQGGANSS